MKNIFPIAVFLLFLGACKSEKSVPANSTVPTTEVAVNKATVLNSVPLTSVSKGMADTLYAMVDYIDYLWPSMPISTSLEERDDIKMNIGMISTSPQPFISSNCKPLGRKFFNIKGNTYASADVYFSEGCKFYVFLNGEKPIHANLMTKDAIAFYNAILTAGKQSTIK